MDLAQDIAHAYTLDSLFQQCVELNSFAVRRDMQAFALGRSNFICLSDLCGKLGFFVRTLFLHGAPPSDVGWATECFSFVYHNTA